MNLKAIVCALIALVLPLSLAAAFAPARAAEDAVVIPAPAHDNSLSAASGTETAVLAGGCFWGVQGVFQHVKGVTMVWSGYSGGAKDTARYHTVGNGTTGHAESVEVTFDPHQISYGQILQIFFSVAHNPTELNYQGPDHGTQYRSAIFFKDDTQKTIAESYIAQLDQAKVFDARVVTEVTALKGFYRAEGYHQDYLTLHPEQLYIAVNDLPKVANLKKVFPALYRDQPVLVNVSANSN